MKKYQVIDWTERKDFTRPAKEDASQLESFLNRKAVEG